jgi:hypothetical protein
MGAHACTKSAKPNSLLCKTNSDCTEIKVDCCDCNSGGKKRAINKHMLQEELDRLLVQCEEILCIQALSTDESCTQKSACQKGICVLK